MKEAIEEENSKDTSVPGTRVIPVYSVVFGFFFALTINRVCIVTLLYRKVCLSYIHNETLCANSSFTKSHPRWQSDTTVWNNYISLIQIVPSVISNLMLSSYCDKVGLKLPLLLPLIGNCLSSAWLAIMSTGNLTQWPIDLILVYGFLNSFLGYFPLIITSSFSYAAIVAPTKKRPIYIALLEATFKVGELSGNLLNGPIVDHWGLDTMCYVSAGVSGLMAICGLLFVTEIPRKYAKTYKWKEMLSPVHLLDSFRCVFKKRPSNSRTTLQLSYAAYFSDFIGRTGYGAVDVLYYTDQIGMSLTQLSMLKAASEAFGCVVAPILMMCTRKLGIGKYHLTVMTDTLSVLGYIVICVSLNMYAIWVGVMLTSLYFVSSAMTREHQASVVSKDELGQVYAYSSLLQVLLYSLTPILFNSLYGWTVVYWSGMVFSFSGLCMIVSLFFFSILTIKRLEVEVVNNNPDEPEKLVNK